MPDFREPNPEPSPGVSPPEPDQGAGIEGGDGPYQAHLQEELEAARRKRDTYQALLKELPEVFEGKFRERVRPLQQRNEQLIAEGEALRDQIRRALPGAQAAPPAAIAPGPSGAASLAAAAPGAPSAAAPGAAPGAPTNAAAAESPPFPPGPGSAAAIWPGWLSPNRKTAIPAAAAAALLLLAGLALGPRLAPRGPEGTASRTGQAGPTGRAGDGGATAPTLRPGWLALRTSGPSWIEVRDGDDRLLFTNELNGQRQFPLGRGLRVRSGRADLVWIRQGNQPERPLGGVEMVGWRNFAAVASPAP